MLVLGIVGAIVLRTVFIFAGIAILDAIDWFTYVLGVLLAVHRLRRVALGRRTTWTRRTRAS